jgi:hypothetical protein
MFLCAAVSAFVQHVLSIAFLKALHHRFIFHPLQDIVLQGIVHQVRTQGIGTAPRHLTAVPNCHLSHFVQSSPVQMITILAYCLSLDTKLSIYDVRDLNFDETVMGIP